MPRVIAALMRHGHYHQPPHTPSAHLPYPLTELGESQADAGGVGVAEVAAEMGWTLDSVIETSHLLRAWQTGSIIARRWSEEYGRPFDVSSFEELAERCVGSAANLSESEIDEIVRQDPRLSLPADWRLDSRLRLPFSGAESLMESGLRVLGHLDRRFSGLAREVRTDTVRLVVGHGGSIRHAAIHMGILTLEEVGKLSMENGATVYFERESDGGWKHVLGEWKVRNRKPTD